ncbi:MAG: hypothetical protein C0604_05710 [Clostridiales bacterium]|nr:MAG: hypothetical protein C0604_05710 [Clostridiales bacterium]
MADKNDCIMENSEGQTECPIQRELEFLESAVSGMSCIKDANTLFWFVLEKLVWEFGFYGGGIYLIDKESGMADLRYASGIPLDYVAEIIEVNPKEKPYSFVFKDLQSKVIDECWTVPSNATIDGCFSVCSMAAIPLICDGEAFGSINIFKNVEPLTKSEIAMLEIFGRVVGDSCLKFEPGGNYRKAYENLKKALDSVKEMIFVTNPDGRILWVNRNVLKISDREMKSFEGKSILEMYSPDNRKEIAGIFEDAQRTGEVKKNSSQMVSPGNESVESSSVVAPGLWNGEDAIFTLINNGIPDIQRHSAQYFFEHDYLTEIYNRIWMEDRLHEICRNKKFPSSLVIMDINGFRMANEVLDHRQGDQILRFFAKKIMDECREEDMLARWGGDEFALLMEGLDESSATEAAERIQEKAKIVLQGTVKLDLSFGVAALGEGSNPIEKAITRAEDMMFRQKLLSERSIQNSIIVSIQMTIQERNLETEEHTERMAVMAEEFALYLNMPKTKVNDLLLLTTLHDIGKIGIPDDILLKEGPLSDSEWEYMKMHSEIGCRIIESTKTLRRMGKYILSHHEKWDGTGYPDGLFGEEIPDICRIMTIIDAFDVMTNERPYKEPISATEALLEIKRCSGTQFDPVLAERFVDFMQERLNMGTDEN